MSGGGGGSSTVQTVNIPEFLQPLVRRETAARTGAVERLEGQLGSAGAEHLVEPFAAEQQEAFDTLRGRARGAGGFLPVAEEAFRRAARGEVGATTAAGADILRGFADADPLQDPALRERTASAVRRLLPQLSSRFAGGPGLARPAIEQATADALTGLLGQGRQRRLGATQALAGLGSQVDARRLAAAQALPQLGLAGPGLLLDVGDAVQAQGQRALEAPIAAQERLIAAASGTPVGSLLGRTQTETLRPHTNPLAGGLGAGVAGASLLGSLFGGGRGTPAEQALGLGGLDTGLTSDSLAAGLRGGGLFF